MKILLHVEPMMFHGRPFHYWALLDRLVTLTRDLIASAGGREPLDVRLVTNGALRERAVQHHGISPLITHVVRECDLQEVTRRSSLDTLRVLHFGGDPDLEIRLAQYYEQALEGYRPEVIFTVTPSPYWKLAFSNAAVLHVEAGIFSRHPLPHLFFLDHKGLFGNSVLGSCAQELKARGSSPEDTRFMDKLRAALAARIFFHSPFHQLELELRTRFRRLLLLPLQFAGEWGFDLNCGYERQGSYLFDVIQRVSPDTAIIVTEHPTAIWLGDVIDAETREYVKCEHPNVFFAPGAREGVNHAGQIMLHHVDAVASVSSSLGMQALFFGKPLLALGSSHLSNYATWNRVEDFNDVQRIAPDMNGAIAWMMRHYYIPMTLCYDGTALYHRVSKLAEAQPWSGLTPYDAFAADDELTRILAHSSGMGAAERATP